MGSIPSLLLSNGAAAGRLLGEPFLFSAFAASISLIKTTDLFIFSGRERGGGGTQHAICMMQTSLEKAKKHCVMHIF